MHKNLIFILSLVALSSVRADYKVGTASTTILLPATEAKGAIYRPEVQKVGELLKSKRFDDAEKILKELRRKFEGTFNHKIKQYTFQSVIEYQEFNDAEKSEFEWIDWGYKQCLQFEAYIHSDRKEFPEALALLEKIEDFAPISADAACESGYILNQLGKFEQGLAAYKRAYELSLRYASQKSVQALSLRGMGYALGELRRFEEAEAKYRESLEVEPGNRIALGEIDYLNEQRKMKK